MGLWIALTLLLVLAAGAVARAAFLLDARVDRLSRSVAEWGDLARAATAAGGEPDPVGAVRPAGASFPAPTGPASRESRSG